MQIKEAKRRKLKSMRTILHSDLNNFYASCECLRHPEFKDMPLVVCGDSENRHGIVLAKNQKAKNFGIKTGDVLWEAREKCGDLIEVKADFGLYLEYSQKVRGIYEEFTDMVEAFGIDECWLDVTGSRKLFGTGEEIAQKIRKRIKRKLGLSVSIGVSYNKIFAKLGSDMAAPDAVTVITRDNFRQTVWTRPVEELLYVGKETRKKLNKFNIFTIGDIAEAGKDFLVRKLGKWGEYLYIFALGLDESPVKSADDETFVGSIGNSITNYKDMTSDDEVRAIIFLLSESVAERLRESGLGRVKRIKFYARNSDLSSRERQAAFRYPTKLSSEIGERAFELFKSMFADEYSLRSIGISVFDFSGGNEQLSIDYVLNKCEQKEKFEETVDSLRGKYGRNIISRAVIFKDKRLRRTDIKDEHTIQPRSFFKN